MWRPSRESSFTLKFYTTPNKSRKNSQLHYTQLFATSAAVRLSESFSLQNNTRKKPLCTGCQQMWHFPGVHCPGVHRSSDDKNRIQSKMLASKNLVDHRLRSPPPPPPFPMGFYYQLLITSTHSWTIAPLGQRTTNQIIWPLRRQPGSFIRGQR